MQHFPLSIQKAINDEIYSIDDIGMSNAEILMFSDKVLKVQDNVLLAEREKDVLMWLKDVINTPLVLAFEKDESKAYLLMTRLSGEMLETLDHSAEQVIHMLAQALIQWWSIDPLLCPFDYSLETKLQEAYQNILNDDIDVSQANDETYGEFGYKDPLDLYMWLKDHQPEEDIVVSHGDFTFENIIVNHDKVGFIDVGKAGKADRYQDIALAYRGICYRFDLELNVLKGHPLKELFFNLLDIQPDYEKLNYYILLDELS